MNPLGTREQPGAAVRYEVRENYRRFDQKRHLIYQGEMKRVILLGDDLLGYGKQRRGDRFWDTGSTGF
jgi:hypothetical protein